VNKLPAISTLALHAALAAAATLTLFPLLWMASVSLMSPGEAASTPPPLLPQTPTLENYAVLFRRLDVGRYALNSLAVAAGATAISTLLNTMAGYAFAKLRFAGRDRTFRFLLAALVIPGQVGMLPLFLMLKQLGLVNTYAGVLVPGLASIFGIFLVRQYVLGIPDALLDAARVDGAGEWRIFRSIVLPLSRPILVALGVTTFLGTWNDFLWPLVILSDQDRYTLPVALANLFGEHLQDTEAMMAGAVVTVLPAMVLFLCLQRYYIQGMLGGALKG
jgi:multiple sugar transport system permease protein